MSPELVTRRLRSLVAEIATLDKADTRDILSRLPAEHRAKVEDLLASYDESAEAALGEEDGVNQGSSAANLIFSYVDLSPWLTERLAPARAGARIAPLAWDALRDCAEPFLDNSPLVERGEAPIAPTWIQRLGAGLLGRSHGS